MAGFNTYPVKNYLIRHGEALGNVQEGYYGRTDCPLTARGRQQAVSAGKLLQKLRAEAPGRELLLVASPLERARHTADIIRETAGLRGDFLVEPNWQEIDFGCWETRCYKDLVRENPAACKQLCDDWQNFCYPQGESFRVFSERVIAAWQKWQQIAVRQQKDILVVSHGGVLKVIRIFAEERPWDDFWRLRILPGELQTMSYRIL